MFLFKEQLRWLFINSDDSLQIHNCIFIQTLFLQPVTKSALICDTNLNCVCHCELKDHKIYDMEKIHSVKYSWHLIWIYSYLKHYSVYLFQKQALSPEELAESRARLLNRQQMELANLQRRLAEDENEAEKGAALDWEVSLARDKLALKERHYKVKHGQSYCI